METSGIGDSVVHEETMEYWGEIVEIAKESLLFIWWLGKEREAREDGHV